jgi:hypothetical protein
MNNNYMSGPLEGNGKSWKEVRNEQRKLAENSYLAMNNYMSGPLEGNGKSWKEVRNEQRKLAENEKSRKVHNEKIRLATPKPILPKLQNTRALKRMNAKRNLLTRRRKNIK